jgi:heme-degrading monooxygenase HmoA
MFRALRVWRNGPRQDASGPVFVSVTDFVADRWRDLPRIYWEALRLRSGWPTLPGAVGLCLWTKPLQRRSGSVSLWHDEDDVRAFIGTPLHVAIMKRNRGHGTLVATSWTESTAVSRRTVWQRAAARLART